MEWQNLCKINDITIQFYILVLSQKVNSRTEDNYTEDTEYYAHAVFIF